ncbi:MAG: hypothetical protein K2X90_03120 [Candidatus Babeliaceae bacterium]|nr:hypothetical protein [Candidatus Babeliaceae bacterium]
MTLVLISIIFYMFLFSPHPLFSQEQSSLLQQAISCSALQLHGLHSHGSHIHKLFLGIRLSLHEAIGASSAKTLKITVDINRVTIASFFIRLPLEF